LELIFEEDNKTRNKVHDRQKMKFFKEIFIKKSWL